MTVKYHLETDNLASHSKFFPATIRVPHHQLRNFISTVYENKIYFVHDFDIYVLDLLTNQRSLVATVPFEARCLAAAHGWVCVGGETKGDCAFVQIGHDNADGGSFGLDMVLKMLGKEIVNSMTIHKLPAQHSRHLDEVVVLISNNDRTVTLYSLSQEDVLAVLDHPVAMNYASMSPDSSIIVAVGDSDEVFFYKRKMLMENEREETEMEDFADYEWERIATPKVPCGEGVWDDYSFAVAFSPNGKLCAVSAQGGYITVLDMEKIVSNSGVEQESVICSFRSSRSTLYGCVRSLSFSPEPWDLLAWTEDHGRAGIADVRQGYSRRQCIVLDRDASSKIDVTDATPAEYSSLDVKERLKQQIQRMHDSRGRLPHGARLLDGAQAPLLQQEIHATDHAMDFDDAEQSILDALGTTVDDEETHALRPYSITYNPTPSMQLSATAMGNREYNVQLLNPQSQDITQLPVPRRRNSVILSEPNGNRHLAPAENLRSFVTESPAALSDDSSTPPMSTNDLTPSSQPSRSQPMPYNIPPSDPWHVIEAAMGTQRSNQPARHVNTLAQVEFAIAAERRLANRLERQLADERRLAALLRTELEARERVLEARQQRAQPGQSSENRLSPALEHVLQRQFQNEQESGRQRTNELESEVRLHGQRLERLSGARSLVEAISRPGDLSTHPTLAPLAADIHMLEPTLRHLEEDRRSRRQRIQDLETQLRRAESRIELASVHNSTERAEQRERHHERLLDARFLQSARTGSISLGSSWQTPSSSTSETTDPSHDTTSRTQSLVNSNRSRGSAARSNETGSGVERSTRSRNTELAGRVSELQLARIMLARHSTDGNGNWVAANGYRRLFGPGGRSSVLPALLARNGTESRSLEEAMRDEGLGTAGIGWSPNGKFLYIGTEAGIFEFKVHTRDRMCFPSIEFR